MRADGFGKDDAETVKIKEGVYNRERGQDKRNGEVRGDEERIEGTNGGST